MHSLCWGDAFGTAERDLGKGQMGEGVSREVGGKVGWKLPLKMSVGKPRGAYASSSQPGRAR